MEWNLTTIGILLAVLIVGYLIGLLEVYIKNSRKRRPSPSSEERIPSPDGEVEVLRAWQNSAGGICLEMGGQKIEGKEALRPEQRRRLVNLLLDLRPWLEAGPATPGKTIQERPLQSPAPPAPEKASAQTPAVAPASIVAQIDGVLQAKLIGTPLAGSGIRLQESPGGGIAIYVGLKTYQGINDIPDPEIQAIIRQAIAEWERGR